MTYMYCDFRFYDAAGLNPTLDGTGCTDQKTFATVSRVIPRVAGAGRFELRPVTTTWLEAPVKTVPVTVYANRSATLSAASSSAYKATVSAVVSVTDFYDIAKPARPASGVAVSLQRKVAGTSTWSTVATTRTDAYGRATVRFSNTVSGRLRAVVASAVPNRTVVTAQRTIASVSTVAWSSLPSSSWAGARVYAKVRTSPYEPGAVVRVQVRLVGTSTWRTVTSKVVSSTGCDRLVRPVDPGHLAGSGPSCGHREVRDRVQHSQNTYRPLKPTSRPA